MVFSDTSTRQGIIQDCEFWTGLGDTRISGNTFNLQTFTRLCNAWYHKVVTMILKAQDDWEFDDKNWTDYPEATTPLVANTRDIVFPASLKILKIRRVDITYDGTNYYRAVPIDAQEMIEGLGNDTTVDGRFSRTNPRYDPKANAIWIYPRATQAEVDAGAKARVVFSREVDEFATSDTAQEPGFDEPFHRMIPIGASMDWCVSKGMTPKADLASMLLDYEKRLEIYYGRKNEDRDVVVKPYYVNYG